MARNLTASRRVDTAAARRGLSFSFIGEAFGELRRVTWPTREETFRLTLMVIAVSAAVGVFLGLVDMGFGRLFDIILET